mgnify:CR=1 FL=1
MSLLVPRKINWPGLAVFLAAVVFTLYAALAPGDDTMTRPSTSSSSTA